jgi:subtilisin
MSTSHLRMKLERSDGVFAPGFSALGTKIDLSAPGVGIISTATGEGLAARSGTSVAAAHATGLAALLIAHHPWFKSVLGARNAQRVSGLYQLLREAAPPAFSTAYQRQLGPERVGRGVPLAQRVLLGLQAASAMTGLANPGGPIAQHPFAAFGAPYGAAPAQALYRPY